MSKKYYRLDNILKLNAVYNMIIGQRSNGKTYSTLEYAVNRFIKYGEEFAYVRRYEDECKPSELNKLFANKPIEKWTNGRYQKIIYYQSSFWGCVETKEGEYKRVDILGHRFILANQMEYKSYDYSKITTIIFDEFIAKLNYIFDEFIEFENLLSTIIRKRDNVKIFMLGNTINKYCPYFQEMGLYNVKKQVQGTIDFYNYGVSNTTVAVEYCEPLKDVESKINHSKYFGFNNPKLKMITTGVWELDIYPHLPIKYKPNNVLFSYFIDLEGDKIKCDVVAVENNVFMYFYPKTTDLKYYDNEIVFQTSFDSNPLHHRNILKCDTKYGNIIKKLFKDNRDFYSSNDVGDVVKNYINNCASL